MQISDPNCDKFRGIPTFGQCFSNEIVQTVRVRDLNKAIIHIPYRDIHETLESLLQTYREITQCRQQIANNMPIFRNISKNKQISQSTKLFLQLHEFNNGNIQIGILTQSQLQGNRPFDSVIRHYQINVNTASGKKMVIKVVSTDTIFMVKHKIEAQQKYKIYQQKLIYAGKPLEDDLTLGEYEIHPNSLLYLVLILAEGCFAKGSLIMVSKDIYVNIEQLQYGMKVISYNLEDKQLEEDQVTNVHQTLTDIMVIVELEDRSVIKCTPNHLFLTDLGDWKRFQYRNDQSPLQIGDYLRSPIGKSLKIINMKVQQFVAQPFYHICIKNNSNFIVGNAIAHNMRIYVNINEKIIPFNVQPSDTILSIKNEIKNKEKIQVEKQNLIFAGKQLQNEYTLIDYNIKKQETLHLTLTESMIKSFKELFSSKVAIKLGNSGTAMIDYKQIRSSTVYQTLIQVMDSPKPYYCLMFGKIILRPKDIISNLQKQKTFVKSQDFELILLRNTQKLQFYKRIKTNSAFPSDFKITEPIKKLIKQSKSYIGKNAGKDYQQQEFYTPIHYYTSNLFCGIINDSLRNIDFTNDNIFNSKQMAFIGCLLKSLYKLQNYYGIVHRGMKDIRLSKYQKEGDCFSWKSFTSASKKVQFGNSLKKGTIFHINCLTGKDISSFSVSIKEQQVIFLPFTYFIVQKIAKMETYDQVWLSQMPSPVGFNKDIIVWVDDQPWNNKMEMKSLQLINKEAIQLTNTKMAMKWSQEFNWLLNWMNIKFKVITDMVRIQNDQQNYCAGIDLLEQYYNIQGYSTPILVYCTDVLKAIQNAEKRKINKKRIYKITSSYEDLKRYTNQF